jgi:hypothetical protein
VLTQLRHGAANGQALEEYLCASLTCYGGCPEGPGGGNEAARVIKLLGGVPAGWALAPRMRISLP